MARWTRALAVLGLLAVAAFAVTGSGSAATPAPSASTGQQVAPPWEFAPEPGAGEDEDRGDVSIDTAPYIDPQHRSDPDGGNGGHGNGGHGNGDHGNGGFRGNGFNGLDLRDQRLADGGNQQTVSPPDQGLCTNGLQVLEAVNTVFKVYSPNGNSQSGVEAYVPFFYPGQHQVDRTTPAPVFGPFVSDPKCYFDTSTLRWFMTVLEIDRDPATGAFGTQSHLLIAVSKTPLATTNRNAWYRYSIEMTDNGPTAANPSMPAHPGCPCFGDQPLIGADAYGFYVTTNEFPITENGFNGAQMYAFSKRKLASGQLQTTVIPVPNTFATEPGGIPYSLQPATSPTPLDWNYANNGTEYLEQALEFTGEGDTRIAVYSLTNTKSLDSPAPAPILTPPAIVTVEEYGAPPPADQAPGPYPLGQSFGDPEEQVNTNDDRMNQVTYAAGLLYSGLNTIYSTTPTPTDDSVATAAAWFIVKPKTPTPATTTGTLVKDGYVAINGGSAYYPSIAVNHSGEAVITFSYSGDDYFPSAGYASLDAFRGLGPLRTLAAGQKPLDSFDGYPQEGGDPNFVARWGDYSAATADPFGNLWVATEWIPGTFGFVPGQPTPPSFLSNWGTAVGRVG